MNKRRTVVGSWAFFILLILFLFGCDEGLPNYAGTWGGVADIGFGPGYQIYELNNSSYLRKAVTVDENLEIETVSFVEKGSLSVKNNNTLVFTFTHYWSPALTPGEPYDGQTFADRNSPATYENPYLVTGDSLIMTFRAGQVDEANYTFTAR